MRVLLIAIVIQCLIVVWPSVGQAERRVALVIGNGAYEHATPLPNPANDARAMASALRRLGFEVLAGFDLDKIGMDGLLLDFADQLEGADVALVFYAGHGLQVSGENYLVPVNGRLQKASRLWYETVPLGTVMDVLEDEERINLVFLDACRNNPLAQTLKRGMGRARSSAVGRGLAEIRSGVGTLIVFATSPGEVAADGAGDHSPFTAALLRHIGTPGLEVRSMLGRVRQTVLDETARRQTPWDHSSMTGEFYFRPTAAVAALPAPTQPPATTDDSFEITFWNSIEDSDYRDDFRAYLKRFPDGVFVDLANNRLRVLAPPAKPAREKQPRSKPKPARQDTTMLVPQKPSEFVASIDGRWKLNVRVFTPKTTIGGQGVGKDFEFSATIDVRDGKYSTTLYRHGSVIYISGTLDSQVLTVKGSFNTYRFAHELKADQERFEATFLTSEHTTSLGNLGITLKMEPDGPQ